MHRVLTAAVGVILVAALGPARVTAQTDLDAFMKQVVARRDDNWKKLQQYILDERETFELRGREALDGHDVLRIEYYPERMFSGTDRRRRGDGNEASAKDRARDAEFQRLMNKVALVTLWIEPKAHQILKYTFDNVGFDFLP